MAAKLISPTTLRDEVNRLRSDCGQQHSQNDKLRRQLRSGNVNHGSGNGGNGGGSNVDRRTGKGKDHGGDRIL